MYTLSPSLGRKLADLALASSGSPGVIFDARGVAVVLDGHGAVLATPVTALPHAVNMTVVPQVLQQACGGVRASVDVSIDVDGKNVVITAGDLRWSHPYDVTAVDSLPDWRAAFPSFAVARTRHFAVSAAILQRILAAMPADTVTFSLDRDGPTQPGVIWVDRDDGTVAVSLPPHTMWWWQANADNKLVSTLEKVDVLPKD